MNTALGALLWVLSFFFAAGETSQIKLNYPQLEVVETIRRRFLLALHGDNPDAVGLVAGLTIGERSLLSEEVEEQMRTLSLTHLASGNGWLFRAWSTGPRRTAARKPARPLPLRDAPLPLPQRLLAALQLGVLRG